MNQMLKGTDKGKYCPMCASASDVLLYKIVYSQRKQNDGRKENEYKNM